MIPEAVVDHLGHLGREPVAEVHQVAVHGQLLDQAMGRVEDRHAGRLVDPAALHPHEAVLHHVDAPDAVAAADLVEPADDLEGPERLAVDAHRHAGLETDRHVFDLVGGLLRRAASCRNRPVSTPLTARSSSLPAS